MQDQHSISVASEIRRSLPKQVILSARNLNIQLVGEILENIDGTPHIKTLGVLHVMGEASNFQMKSKIIEAVKEKGEKRQVVDRLTIKR